MRVRFHSRHLHWLAIAVLAGTAACTADLGDDDDDVGDEAGATDEASGEVVANVGAEASSARARSRGFDARAFCAAQAHRGTSIHSIRELRLDNSLPWRGLGAGAHGAGVAEGRGAGGLLANSLNFPKVPFSGYGNPNSGSGYNPSTGSGPSVGNITGPTASGNLGAGTPNAGVGHNESRALHGSRGMGAGFNIDCSRIGQGRVSAITRSTGREMGGGSEGR